MKVAIATLGWHTEYLTPMFGEVDGIQKVVFYWGFKDKADYKAKTLKSVEEMSGILDDMSVKYEAKHLDDIFDFKYIVNTIKTDIEKEKKAGNEVVLIDIAGGTKIMVAAALMVALFKGIPAIYCDEETKDAVRLPLLGFKYKAGLTDREKEVLKFIIDYKDPEELSQTRLAKLLDVEKGTINPQVQSLYKKGAVSLVQSKDGRSKIVKAVEGIDLLLEFEG